MDNVTHSLFAVTLARTPLGRAGRGTTAALLLASNAPDIDIVTIAGGTASYLQWHRGPTHGPLGIVCLAVACAALVWAGREMFVSRSSAPRASFARLTAVALVGVTFHVVMDVPTSYGTRVLSPFAWTWFAEDWFPIVDVYLLAILGAGLLFWRSAPGRSAAMVLTLMTLHYGLRATLHQRAIARAPAIFAADLPPACGGSAPASSGIDRWPRPHEALAVAARPGRCLVDIGAIPDFLSPFRWHLIAQFSDAYHMQTVDLLQAPGTEAATTRRAPERAPNQWSPAVVAASATPVANVFLGFSRFPSVESILEADGTTTVRWTDLRFVAASPGRRGRDLFGVTVRLAPDMTVLDARLGF